MRSPYPPAADLAALSELAPELAATFVSLASDIALVIDRGGVIRNVAQSGSAPLASGAEAWVGRPWADTVTAPTRRKIEQLLEETLATGLSRRREVNHPAPAGGDVPVAYAAVRLGAAGPVLAVGRDLRAYAAIQQRFVETQQELERDYWKRREAESRYRLMFQVATDAVLVVDAVTLTVLDANRAAAALFELAIPSLIGKAAAVGIDRASRPALEELLLTARASGRPAEVRLRLAGARTWIAVSATPFRAEAVMLLLVRARPLESSATRAEAGARLVEFVGRMAEAVLVTDSAGRVLMGNPACAGLLRLDTETQARGRLLAEWFKPGEFAALLAQARHQGMASALLTLAAVPATQVEATAALLPEGDQECLGFTLRAVARPVPAAPAVAEGALGEALARLTVQLGQLNLPALLREANDAAEHHFITLALARADGDRARAAELLGISADSLGLRLHRHGLAAAPAPAE